MSRENLQSYAVWDRPVRLFHWVTVLSLLPLIGIGLVMMFSRELGISGQDKALLKVVHAWFGYIFVINLLIRTIWGFIGNRFARWRAVLPFGKQYKTHFKAYRDSKKNGEPIYFLGHNPLGRISVLVMLLLMSAQSITGLVLGSTDLYYPPFGSSIKTWVAADEASIALIEPGNRQKGIDPEAFQEMRDFRAPYRSWHTWFFYLLMLSIVVHIAAVIHAERKENSGLTSGMITGNKVYSKKPFDAD